MSVLPAAALALAGALPAEAAPDLRVPEGYRLVWADEFDTPGHPDPARWVHDTVRNRDGWYNNEPFYRPFRAMLPARVVREAGFAARDFFEVALPSREGSGDDAAWRRAIDAGTRVESGRTGRLAKGVNWYGFGAWKRPEPALRSTRRRSAASGRASAREPAQA